MAHGDEEFGKHMAGYVAKDVDTHRVITEAVDLMERIRIVEFADAQDSIAQLAHAHLASMVARSAAGQDPQRIAAEMMALCGGTIEVDLEYRREELEKDQTILERLGELAGE